MPIYKAPIDETLFLLNDVFQIGRYNNLPGFADASPDLLEAVLSEAAKLCEEVVQPLNLPGDKEGCTRHSDGSVATPKGFQQAFRKYSEGGWMGISAPAEYGGQGLGSVELSILCEELGRSLAAVPFLPSVMACALIEHAGSPAQHERWLPALASGRSSAALGSATGGTAGLVLGAGEAELIVLVEDDGSYKINGTKIFISAGEHDLSENIVHLVLARIEGAPAGIRGTTLFIVPKILSKADGSLGAKNGVFCGSIEEKMGIHGNSTCVMNYDSATGFLIGEENRGINAMFTMMNDARLGVGVQGLAISEVAYQNAAAYARDRLQGRALTGAKFPDKPADPIIVHPDVRRMLMTIRAFNEAGRALVLWTALQGDVTHRSGDDQAKIAADDHMGLLTPVIKAILTDQGFANAVLAQQVYGGHGYIAEHGMEQFVRDARITMIYEGANGIQALDLVGRKLPKDGGRALQAFFAEVQGYLKTHGDDAMKPYVGPLGTALGHLQQATMWLMTNAMAKPDNAGAASSDYLQLFGLVALGYMWCRMVEAAQAKLAAGAASERMNAKLVTGRFFMERILPETATHLARIQAGAGSLMELPAEAF